MKIQILNALETLLQSKDYSSIEIIDICEAAHISKPTFYRYFKSKDGIFTWVTKIGFRCGIAEIGRRLTWYEGNLVTLMIAYCHSVFYTARQNPELINSLYDSGWRYQSDALCETLFDYKGIEQDEKLVFQVEAVARMQCSMTQKWGSEGMKVPPETMAEYIVSCVPQSLIELLNTPMMSEENRAVNKGYIYPAEHSQQTTDFEEAFEALTALYLSPPSKKPSFV